MTVLNIERIANKWPKKSKLGKEFFITKYRTIYHVQCDSCGRKLTRSKGEAYKMLERNRHACSPECAGKLGRIEKHVPRKARRKSGYIYIGKHREHQLVAETMIGRKLNKDEVVHHIDGDKGNNQEENLIVSTRKEHNRIHGQLEGLAFLMVQQGTLSFCKKCKLYTLKTNKCGCGSSFSA